MTTQPSPASIADGLDAVPITTCVKWVDLRPEVDRLQGAESTVGHDGGCPHVLVKEPSSGGEGLGLAAAVGLTTATTTTTVTIESRS